MKRLLLVICLLPVSAFANFTAHSPQGFHWYTVKPSPRVVKPRHQPVHAGVSDTVSHAETLSPEQRLHALTQVTRNTMAVALLNPTVNNTARYMRAQQFWAKQDQRFVRSWQEALLQHPELDYSLNFPTNNNAIPIRNDEHKALVERTINEMSKHYGLVFFYRGHSSVCQKFAAMLLPFVNRSHFAMVSVTTDGQPIIGLPNPRSISIGAIKHVMPIESRYLPALFLVTKSFNCTTKP